MATQNEVGFKFSDEKVNEINQYNFQKGPDRLSLLISLSSHYAFQKDKIRPKGTYLFGIKVRELSRSNIGDCQTREHFPEILGEYSVILTKNRNARFKEGKRWWILFN